MTMILFPSQVIQRSQAIGDDPNIVYPTQIRAGTPLRQGPQGPIISSPRPQSMAVPQTPLAPQTRDPDFKQRYSTESILSTLKLPDRRGLAQPSHVQPSASPRPQGAARREDGRPLGLRRQDFVSGLLPLALGGSGVSPVGIFSNLLNAYATIDSKHDITGKLINGAASWFQGPTQESRTTDTEEESEVPTPTPTSSTSTSTKKASKRKTTKASTGGTTVTTTKSNRKWPKPTSTNLRVKDRISSFSSSENEEYQSLMERIRAATKDSSEYDVVTSNYDSLPAKSNVFGNGPLRPKPPSENIIQVSPSPQGFGEAEELPQLGVDNPYWFSDSQQFSPSSTPGYGPDDFVVETVNLDKDFFYQFFTSKPMIIDTDVVTSTSVQVNEMKL